MESQSLQQRFGDLAPLARRMVKISCDREKTAVLDTYPAVKHFLRDAKTLSVFLNSASEKEVVAVKAIAAIGEGPVVFRGFDGTAESIAKLQELVEVLCEVESFYDTLGGIVGYHCKVMELILRQDAERARVSSPEHYTKPRGFQLNSAKEPRDRYVQWGVEHLPEMAEIYPIGGAGERLNLQGSKTGEPLPVALMHFGGRTLLEGLIRDLQAREYLYYKLKGEQLTTPILMMTSQAKHNHQRIQKLCRESHWFDRGEENFFFFVQPLAPVITVEGHWSMSAPLVPTLQPGGHGVIWKLAKDHGAFEWLRDKGRTKALLRQINNPVAGTDLGLLAFGGIGCHYDKAFGFASCPRAVHAAEGMDVLVETEVDGKYSYRISNIEYTDFAQKGLEDKPEEPGSPYSKFPANTNILFVDLQAIETALSEDSFPGTIINMKRTAPFVAASGEARDVPAGRLECMMQNIADEIVEPSPHRLEGEALRGIRTFLTYNERRKTISVTKQALTPDRPLMETPEGCFYDSLQNLRELFSRYCGVDLPEICSEEIYRKEGPNLQLLMHPALGPLYSVIAQKVRGGTLRPGAEMQLEIAELDLENLHLDGSLLIRAESPLGKTAAYGKDGGKCVLRNVRIKNRGIDRDADNVFWRNEIVRREKVKIVLQGSGEFFAEDLSIEGGHTITVPDGYRFIAYNDGRKLSLHKEEIDAPSWSWDYAFDEAGRVTLKRSGTPACRPR